MSSNIDENALVQMEDWIGIYNGDNCVGSWPWMGEYTTVPAMGDDGNDFTSGYLETGDIPSFKIYDNLVVNIMMRFHLKMKHGQT